MRDLSSIVKAYDVRGTVPDQFDALTARALGAAFARFAAAPQIVVARDMRESGVELGQAFAEGALAPGSTSSTPGSAPPTCCTTPPARSACPARCSPRATTRPATTASRCAWRGPARSARTPASLEIRRERRGLPRRGPAGRPHARHADDARPAGRLRGAPARARAGHPRRPAAQGGRRLRQRHGRAHRAGRARRPAARGRADVLRARRLVPQPRGQPDRPGEPGGPAGPRRRRGRRPRAWPSTATPTGASSSTSAASRSARRR